MPAAAVNCDAIPRKVYRGRECFDWKHAIGVLLPFHYGTVTGVLKILDAETRGRSHYITVQYQNTVRKILSSSLTAGHIGSCVGGRTPQPKFQPGQRLCDRKRDLTILDVSKGTLPYSPYSLKLLTYRCNRCGYESQPVRECSIARGTGCPVCNGKIVVSGYNDLATTAPWMIPYFPDGAEQASAFTSSSGQALQMKCPHCGKLTDHPIKIAALQRTHSIGCPCGDGVSLPEKFVFHFFQAINVPYRRQISSKDFAWCGKHRYDGMFQTHDAVYLVEVHGIQHFEHSGYEKLSATSLEATQENDRQKKQLALQNGIPEANYIVLDCRQSTLAHLKAAILRSRLAAILGLQAYKIDWALIYQRSLAPLPKAILDYALAHPHASGKEIAAAFGVSAAYPANVLTACGRYSKTERAQRRSSAIFEENRAQLHAEIRKLMQADSHMTIARMAQALGRSVSGMYAFLKKYPADIDIDTLRRNAEQERSRCARARICKPVHVTAPDQRHYQFSSLTDACRDLEEAYRIPLSPASVSIAIAKSRTFRGFTFRYMQTEQNAP